VDGEGRFPDETYCTLCLARKQFCYDLLISELLRLVNNAHNEFAAGCTKENGQRMRGWNEWTDQNWTSCLASDAAWWSDDSLTETSPGGSLSYLRSEARRKVRT